jgi:hypothetical protein
MAPKQAHRVPEEQALLLYIYIYTYMYKMVANEWWFVLPTLCNLSSALKVAPDTRVLNLFDVLYTMIQRLEVLFSPIFRLQFLSSCSFAFWWKLLDNLRLGLLNLKSALKTCSVTILPEGAHEVCVYLEATIAVLVALLHLEKNDIYIYTYVYIHIYIYNFRRVRGRRGRWGHSWQSHVFFIPTYIYSCWSTRINVCVCECAFVCFFCCRLIRLRCTHMIQCSCMLRCYCCLRSLKPFAMFVSLFFKNHTQVQILF